MADSQSKIDAAAEKAFAEAAEKNAVAEVASKPAPAAPVGAAPVVKADAAPKPVAAPKAATAKPAADKVPAKKPAAKTAAVRKVVNKPVVKKSAAKKPAPAAIKTASLSAPIIQLKDKIMNTAKTTDFTKTATDAVSEMQTRAQTALAKGSEMTADMSAFYKGNFDALVRSGKVLAAGMQDLGRNAVEDAKAAAETVTADVKQMAAVKSPTELFQLQGEIARRNLDTLVAKTSKNAEVMMKLATDMFAPLSTRASVAMERLKKAA